MTDFVDEINRLHRRVGTRQVEAGEARTVLLRRSYDAEIADVWDAVTSPERIARWFLPVSGEFKVGGRYQLEGQAGGEILQCDRPTLLRVSWLYGPDPGFSEVSLRLTPEGEERTRLYREMQRIVVEDCVWIFKYRRLNFNLIQPWLHGYRYNDIVYKYFKYCRVDDASRATAVADLNRKNPWPAMGILGVFAALVGGGYAFARRSNRGW